VSAGGSAELRRPLECVKESLLSPSTLCFSSKPFGSSQTSPQKQQRHPRHGKEQCRGRLRYRLQVVPDRLQRNRFRRVASDIYSCTRTEHGCLHQEHWRVAEKLKLPVSVVEKWILIELRQVCSAAIDGEVGGCVRACGQLGMPGAAKR
jgi:hypothetical protein